MPTTYTLISSNVLTSSAASVTFSSIPATYTDLVLRTSTRTDNATAWNGTINIRYNNLSTTIYSYTRIRANGSTATSSTASAQTFNIIVNDPDTAGNTTNTFVNQELYIPNYTSTTQKPASNFAVGEENSSAAYMMVNANLVNLTSAITDLLIYPSVSNFVSGSSFYLYGISNA